MKIASSNIVMDSSRAAVEHDEQRENLRVWQEGVGELNYSREGSSTRLAAEAQHLIDARGGSPQGGALAGLMRPGRGDGADVLHLSDRAKAVRPVKHEVDPGEIEVGPMDELKMSIVKQMVESLTGKEMKLFSLAEFQERLDEVSPDAAEVPTQGPPPEGRPAEGAAAEREGWGVVYEYSSFHYEAEQTSFSAQGVVTTADGREIKIDAAISMSREFMSREQLSVRAGDALKDPLVINFNGAAAELTDTKFQFDIDVDGKADQISFVGPNSGFLALDKDGNGVVNDGSELFGAVTGNGFAELARYDEDGNNWIDENDSIYDRLRIWSKDAQGNDSLLGLGQRGVGAIYLGNVGTEFALMDDENQQQGQVRSSGIYLHEDGRVDSVQQIDLVV